MKKNLKCFYDLSVCPSSYDIITFLISAEVTRIRRNLGGLEIYFLKGPNNGFRIDNRNKSLDENNMFFDNVMLPSLNLLKSVKSFKLSERNDFSLPYFNSKEDEIYPRGYDPYKPILGHPSISGQNLVSAHLMNNKTGWFSAPNFAKKIAIEFCKTNFNKHLVTLTTREADDFDVNKTRRINIKNWEIIFEKCLKMNLQPIIIRDTDKAFDKNPIFGNDIIELPLASLHLPFRIALYELSLINFFTIGGPGTLSLWGKYNSVHLYKFDEDSPPVSSKHYKQKYAMTKNSIFPMTTINTNLLWGAHDPDNILKKIYQASNNAISISEKLNLLNKTQIINSIYKSLEILMIDLTNGNLFLEDINLFSNLSKISEEKKLDINPYEIIKKNEGVMSYADRLLPKGISEKLLKFSKENNLNANVA